MGMFSNLFNRKEDWQQGSKEVGGWISNFDPQSRRYLNKDGQLELDKSDTSEKKPITMSANSTCVKAYTYDPATENLYLQFVNGNKEYTYPNVPRDVIEDFGEAPSKGRFVHDVISGYSAAN
jgi:hypothetical protein